MSDREDRFMAAVLTFFAILFGLFVFTVYASLLIAAPIVTILVTVGFWFTFKRVYPRIFKWMNDQ